MKVDVQFDVQKAPNTPLIALYAATLMLKTNGRRVWPFASGAKGRWFESTRAYQINQAVAELSPIVRPLITRSIRMEPCAAEFFQARAGCGRELPGQFADFTDATRLARVSM
jgi:hypothetical protein